MCGRAQHPSLDMLDHARRLVQDEREAEEHAWTEQKMAEHIALLQAHITEKRRELKHEQQRLHEFRKRRTTA